MAFIHAANVSIHEPSDYNPFRRQLTASQRQKLYLAFKHTLPYLSCAEYKSCAAVDTSFHQMIMQQLLEKPSFHDGHVHDALHLLVKWVDLLPHFRPETAALIKHLDVSHIEDSLYERVPSYFFEYLLRYTPNLQVLQLSRTSFLQCRNSLPPRYELRHLHTLDLSYCDNISSATLCALSARLPCLQHVKLDGIASNIDEGVAALAHRGELQSISMRNCSSISDVAMYSLAKFRTIKLKEIDVSGCRKITENGFLILAKYNIHLQLLGL
ncbi:uncharacterized protein BYT42DRAFT_500997, partial [Radiomyces spectabilis]|uniref:uncharacterized protein n=1 Tax=Radiomyces spectabilis TaxID=64574 RepID=UPI002220EBB9